MAKKGLLIMIGVPKSDRAGRAMDGAGGRKESGYGPDGDDGMADHGGDGDAYACVPIESIAADDENPGPGDKVDFSVEGVVKDITNGMARIEVKTVNGESVAEGEEGDEGDEDNDEDEGTDGQGGETSPETPSIAPGTDYGRKESLSAMGRRLRSKAAKLSM